MLAATGNATIGGKVTVNGSLVAGGTNVITSLGSKLPTAGGSITGNLEVSGRIATDRIIGASVGLVTADDNMTVTGSLTVQDGG